MQIAFTKPFLTKQEGRNIELAIKNGPLSGDGPFAKKCQAWLEKNIGCRKALLTPSATSALEMAALLIGIKPGDEVIMPSYTFVSTANAFVLFGAKPVFVDARPDTLNLDEKLIEKALTRRTRAIVAVHYGGVAVDMSSLKKISQKHGLYLIEDAAQSLGASYKGKPLGAWGDLAALSFHATKNIQCGEGGALLINNTKLVLSSEIIHEKGTNRSRFLRGEVDKYTWINKGSSYLPSEMQAAYLLAQLEECKKINGRRMKIWQNYDKALRPFAVKMGFRILKASKEVNHNAHLYWILFENKKKAASFFKFMRAKGIEVSRHYVPLHSSPAGHKFGRVASQMTITDQAGSCLVRLPLWAGMNAEEISYVIQSARKFLMNPS